MILYGRNLSPFVRRVAIWCAVQQRPIDHRPLAATEPADAEAIRAKHPGLRVPALELADGEVLIETWAITDWLDETAGLGNGKRLVPASGEARRQVLQRIGLATATVEKMVSLVYEKNRRPAEFQWPAWQERLVAQIRGGLAAMERSVPAAAFFGGAEMDGSDIATLCAYEFGEVTNGEVLGEDFPGLAALCRRCSEQPGVATTHPNA